jgi:putative addiction module killer protein
MKYTVMQTEEFREWHKNVKDRVARIAIARRLERAENGNFGDTKSVGDGVSEMRVDVGAGYRLYYTIRNNQVVFFIKVATSLPSNPIYR